MGKLCKDNKLLSAKFNANSCDLLFTSVKTKGRKTINFSQFEKTALPKLAQKVGISEDELKTRLAGPKNSGTKAQYNKFYDDKSTWGGGVHAHGGPTTVDGTITLSNLADRSGADVRGVKY